MLRASKSRLWCGCTSGFWVPCLVSAAFEPCLVHFWEGSPNLLLDMVAENEIEACLLSDHVHSVPVNPRDARQVRILRYSCSSHESKST